VLSSHILAEVEALCDRVSSIRGGRTVESATLASLRHLTCTSISAELKNPPAGITAISVVHDLVVEGTRVRCTVDAERLDEVLRELTRAGVQSLLSQPPTLEELFMRHYGLNADSSQSSDGGASIEHTLTHTPVAP
jgi:ABC-2 type transport system ATP-binding protein